MNAIQKADKWWSGVVKGAFEGYCSYALIDGQWFSVNGSKDEITDIRWKVSHPVILDFLNRNAQ